MNDYFDEKGIIKLEKNGPHPVENTSLFHITYLMQAGKYYQQNPSQVLNFLTQDLTEVKGSRSHDNMTAILTYLVIHHNLLWEKSRTIQNFKIFPDYTHPRDFLYIAYLQRKWWTFLLGPLIYVAFLLIFGYMAITKIKVTPGLWERFKKKQLFGKFKKREIYEHNHYDFFEYKNNTEKEYRIAHVFKTDTEILYWIRLQLPKKYWLIHLTKWPIEYLLKRKFGEDWFKNCMDIYYHEPEHPNRSF